MFEIILPFKDIEGKEVKIAKVKEEIITAFKEKFSKHEEGADKYEDNYCKYYEDKIEIKDAFFADDKRVKDVWRYNIIKNNDESIDLETLADYEHPFCCSKFIDKNLPKQNQNICLLIIESPHKEEYCRGSEFVPVAPAQGKTGENIEKYFCKIVNANDEIKKLFTDNMQLVICNPVQFQTSLYELHRYPTLKKYAEVKAQIWYELFENYGEKEKFIERIREYEPKIIINACTGLINKKNIMIDPNEIITTTLKEAKKEFCFYFTYNQSPHPFRWFKEENRHVKIYN